MAAHPPNTRVVVRLPATDVTLFDRLYVILSSLFFVGGVVWVPALYAWAWRRIARIPKESRKRRALYTTVLLAATALFAVGPHRTPRFGERIQFRKWTLWDAWLRFFAYEIIEDVPKKGDKNLSISEKSIIAIVPHGIFPFALAFAVIGEASQYAFGKFRAVVASATGMLPWVRDLLRWVHAV